MKTAELRGKDAQELRQELQTLLREQFAMRMQQATDQKIRSHRFKLIRQDVARIYTVLRQKELQGELA
jgi:large subunit ribosomal protein L29